MPGGPTSKNPLWDVRAQAAVARGILVSWIKPVFPSKLRLIQINVAANENRAEAQLLTFIK